MSLVADTKRFVTLHRNGSASLNRIYTRQFDPYEIFAELKRQNNFADEPTTVRVVLHLSDIRILAVGVLLDRPNMFVNRNAHEVLHPPAVREAREARAVREARMHIAGQGNERHLKGKEKVQVSQGRLEQDGGLLVHVDREQGDRGQGSASGSVTVHKASESAEITATTAGASTSTHTATTHNPLIRAISINPNPTIDPSTSSSPTDPSRARRSTFSSLFSRTWSSTAPNANANTNPSRTAPATAKTPLLPPSLTSNPSFSNASPAVSASGTGWFGSMLTQVRSRDSVEEAKRRRSLGLSRKGSGSSLTIPAAALFGEVGWGAGGVGSKSRRSSMSTGTAGCAARGEGAIQEDAQGNTGSGTRGGASAVVEGGRGASDEQRAAEDDADTSAGPTPESAGHDGDGAPDMFVEPANRTVQALDEDRARGGHTSADENGIVGRARQQPLDLAYPIMFHPQPATSHRYYPNITPDTASPAAGSNDTAGKHGLAQDEPVLRDALDTSPLDAGGSDLPESRLVDRRGLYDEIEDDYAGYLFSANEVDDAGTSGSSDADGRGGSDEKGREERRRYVEWHAAQGRKRWVGPML